MASPAAAAPLPNGHPSTPPPSDIAPPPTTTTTTAAPARQPDPEVPLTSLQDDGQAKRPRDVKLINVVLHAQGIESYQERVPLQLLDFAYRYTSGVLSDSLRLSAEGYAGLPNGERTGAGGRGRGGDAGAAGGAGGSEGITVPSLRQAIASRSGHTFTGHLPKEFMLEQAAERNRVALPKVERSWGVQLPPEKYCLTGTAWNLKEEWESDGEEEEEDVGEEMGGMNGDTHAMGEEVGRQDQQMGGMNGAMDEGEDEDEDEEGAGKMEDFFVDGDGGGDTTMAQD
ncbi:hypothetical protein LTR36_007267 [Oleoguttula mirabilis]|uniref:TFIID-31kDa-domain-containing protein n=1 Tax=Oleoguttula mirabilis TaxID=1507867 RepID=A0AAV9JAE9_9PEZI|nr:hypothetical protein LTR36_007267 [Oleoguttula mirabilis]